MGEKCKHCGSANVEIKATGSLDLRTKEGVTRVLNTIDQVHCQDCGEVSEVSPQHIMDKLQSSFFGRAAPGQQNA
jgi:transposase